MTTDPKAPKSQLDRFDKQRKEVGFQNFLTLFKFNKFKKHFNFFKIPQQFLQILANQEKSALSDLAQRKQKLLDEVAGQNFIIHSFIIKILVLNTQTNSAINEYERLVKEIEVIHHFLEFFKKLIQHEEQHAKDLKANLEQTVATFKKAEQDEAARLARIQKEKEERVN